MNLTRRCSTDEDTEAQENLSHFSLLSPRPELSSSFMTISLSFNGTGSRDYSRKEKGHRMSFLWCHLNTTPSYLICFSGFCWSSDQVQSFWPDVVPHTLLCSLCADLTGLPFGPWVILMSTLERQTWDFLCLNTPSHPSHLVPGLLLLIHLRQLNLTSSGSPP